MKKQSQFKLCILFGDDPGRDPAVIAPGWEMAEIPVALQVKPFESAANWARQVETLVNWNLPPIKVASHFLQFWGLAPVGPVLDWEQLVFWTQRAFVRLAELGVETVGVYGSFFKASQGFSHTQAMDQAIQFAILLADQAEAQRMRVALEPTADPHSLFPMYLDGLNFVKIEIGRECFGLLADLNYFIRGNQPLEHIALEPDYLLHVHIAGDHGQPGVGNLEPVYLDLFRILRDIGYSGGVSAACPWVSTQPGELEFARRRLKP